MKGWQWVLVSWMGLFVFGLVVVLAAWAGMMSYPLVFPPTTQEVIQPTPIVITVEKIIERVVEVPVAQPTAIPQVIPISIEPQPTPVPEVEGPEEKCADAATITVETPYFKTWHDVTAKMTVWNMGTCFWENASHYIAPFSFPIPEVLPGGFVVVQVPIDVQPGLTAITPVVMGEFGESLTPQMQMDAATGQPAALEQFDYASPQSSVPPGAIVINYPTQDWEGLQLPIWKPVPGLPGWWYLKGGDGTGYHFPGSEGGGCRGGG